jgi:hypothetical protein
MTRRFWGRRTTGLMAAAGVTIALCAGCSGGGTTPLTAPKGGYAADKSDPTTVQWFKSHTATVQALGDQPTIPTTGTPNYSAISASCLSFSDDVAAAKQLSHIPNASAQALWAYAIKQFESGVAFCSDGAVKQDASDLTEASTELTEGHQTLAYLIFGTPIPKSSSGTGA